MEEKSAEQSGNEEGNSRSKVESFVILPPLWPYQDWQTIPAEEAKEPFNATTHTVIDLIKDLSVEDKEKLRRETDTSGGLSSKGNVNETTEKDPNLVPYEQVQHTTADKVTCDQLSMKTDTASALDSKKDLNEKTGEDSISVTLYKRIQPTTSENLESAVNDLEANQKFTARNTDLHTFLKQFNNDLKVNLDVSDQNPVMTELNGMIENVVKQLQETHDLFKNCKLLRAGSVAEKTKIGKLNEFDFLLVIERFNDSNNFDIDLDITWMRLRAKNSPENEKLCEMFPTLFTSNEPDGQIYLTNIRSIVMGQFLNLLRNNMLEDWKIVTTDEERICQSDIATTLHLFSQRHDIDVDIDICLCIPVPREYIPKASIYLKDERSVTYFRYIELLLEGTEKLNKNVFAIVGREESVFHDTPISGTRLTVPLLELSTFLHYGPNDGRVITYRLAKCIASYFFPKATKFVGCPRCSHCIVKSYHLKNIIFFMIKNYKDERMWAKERIPYRLIEVFDILLKCIPDDSERHEKVAKVSTCCTPGTLRMDCISTYNPFTPNYRGKRDHYLFSPDSHKPMYDLSYCPTYVDHLKTGEEKIDVKIKQYFDYVTEDHWDSYEIVSKVVALLHEMIAD